MLKINFWIVKAFFAVTIAGNVQNMKPVQIAQVSYSVHYMHLELHNCTERGTDLPIS